MPLLNTITNTYFRKKVVELLGKKARNLFMEIQKNYAKTALLSSSQNNYRTHQHGLNITKRIFRRTKKAYPNPLKS